MQARKKWNVKSLYQLWAGLFVLTAALGLLFPNVAGGGRIPLLLISVLFFVPPWLIVRKARAQGNGRHVKIVRYLSLASLMGTVALMAASIRSIGAGEAVGNALHVALTIVSAPMICSNLYALPLFLWGALLVGTFTSRPGAGSDSF